MRKISNIALIWKILIAIVLGILLGMVVHLPVIRAFQTFNALFSQFISFMVPLIIVGLVTPAIARMGKGAGKLLLITVGIAYASTVLAGLFSYSISAGLFPNLLEGKTLKAAAAVDNIVEPYFTIGIPPMIDVMTALVFSFICGIFLTQIKGETLAKAFNDFEQVVTLTIGKVLIPLLPLYIMSIFMKMSYTGEAVPIIKIFAVVILIIFAMTVVYLLFLFGVAGMVSGRNPLKSFAKMLPAYITALGTSSSAATIPVTLKQAMACGARKEIAGFTVPLCATVHMPGSIIEIVACAATIMIAQGMTYSPQLFIGFILLLAITMVAAPGVPGGPAMAMAGLLGPALGFDETNIALMVALCIVMDSFGTSGNVTGDGAIAMIVDKIGLRMAADKPSENVDKEKESSADVVKFAK